MSTATTTEKMKHLLASSATLDGMQELVDKFFAGDHKPIVATANPRIWLVTRTAGTPIDGVQIRKAGKRYRFEMR